MSGTSRLVFGNQFIIRKSVDTVTSATTTTVNVRYVLPSAATSPAGPAIANFVAKDQSFTGNVNTPFRFGTALVLQTTPRFTSGSARVYIDTVSSPAATPGFVWVTGDNKPIFIINDMYAANRERDQQLSPLYPGYTVVPRDSANAASGLVQELTPFGALRDRNFVFRGVNDTVSTNARQFLPQVQPLSATAKRVKGGQYTITWQTDPFGPKAPFLLDPVANLQPTVVGSIVEGSAKSTTITETSAATATLVGATAARPLQRVRVPFTMSFKDVDGRSENVRFAMLARSSNTRLLGSRSEEHTSELQSPC